MDKLHEELSGTEIKHRYTSLYRSLMTRYIDARRPLSGSFELTPHCTLDCKMCYVHTSNNVYPGKVLTGDQWIQIIDEAVDAGMLYASLSGGECTLHPDFRRIYEHLKMRGVFVSILSNGTLLDRDMVSWFKERPPRFIRITVYGSCPEVYEQVTGCAEAFNKVDTALNLLDEAGIVTDISMTISRYNYADFPKLLSYVRSKPYARLNMDCDLMEPRDETHRSLSDFSLSLEEQETVLRTYYNSAGFSVPSVCEDDFLMAEKPDSIFSELSEKSRYSMPCAAGLCCFSVSYDGHMQPCAQFSLASVKIPEGGFLTAWESINQAALAYRRSRECTECQYLGECSFCPAIYSLNGGGKSGLPGEAPCNKKQRMLKSIMLKTIQEVL